MNRGFLIIVGAIFILLSVFFGRNPVEEARKEREKGMTGDPVIDAITKYNEDHKYKNMLTYTPDDGTPPQPGDYYQPNNRPGHFTVNRQPSYMMRTPGTDPFANTGNPYMPPSQSDDAAAPPPSNSYYPPPPLPANQGQPGNGINPMGPQSFMDMFPRAFPGFPVHSGQRVKFVGTKVFTSNSRGQAVPMPDGVYTLSNGKAQIIIQNGEHIMRN